VIQVFGETLNVTGVRPILTCDLPKAGEAGAAYQTLRDDSAYGWPRNCARRMDADVAALNWCGDAACRVVAQIAPQVV